MKKNEKELKEISEKKVIEIFGSDYLKKQKGIILAEGCVGDKGYMYFLGIKTSDDLPNRPCTDKGWVVYADIYINVNTGDIEKCEYALE